MTTTVYTLLVHITLLMQLRLFVTCWATTFLGSVPSVAAANNFAPFEHQATLWALNRSGQQGLHLSGSLSRQRQASQVGNAQTVEL